MIWEYTNAINLCLCCPTLFALIPRLPCTSYLTFVLFGTHPFCHLCIVGTVWRNTPGNLYLLLRFVWLFRVLAASVAWFNICNKFYWLLRFTHTFRARKNIAQKSSGLNLKTSKLSLCSVDILSVHVLWCLLFIDRRHKSKDPSCLCLTWKLERVSNFPFNRIL